MARNPATSPTPRAPKKLAHPLVDRRSSREPWRWCKGFNGLATLVQSTLEQNPFYGHLFVFRRRRGDMVKMLWFDGDGLCLLAKRLERGRFVQVLPGF